jgi:hypothetical protein
MPANKTEQVSKVSNYKPLAGFSHFVTQNYCDETNQMNKFIRLKHKEKKIFESPEPSCQFIQSELKNIDGYVLKENLVRHFDAIHKVREVELPKLGQITLSRKFGNDITFRNKSSQKKLTPIGGLG